MTPQPQQDRCVLTRHDVQSIKDLVFVVGGNSESSAQKAIFEILANNMRRSRPHPAPAFKRCCDSCINVPCKVLNRVPCLAQEKQENVCEETGCTDIENCDEICQHSRLFSPLQMQEAKKDSWEQGYQDGASAVQHDLNLIKDEAARKARNATLDAFEHIELLHADDVPYADLYNEFIRVYKSLREQP